MQIEIFLVILQLSAFEGGWLVEGATGSEIHGWGERNDGGKRNYGR